MVRPLRSQLPIELMASKTCLRAARGVRRRCPGRETTVSTSVVRPAEAVTTARGRRPVPRPAAVVQGAPRTPGRAREQLPHTYTCIQRDAHQATNQDCIYTNTY